MRHTTIFEKVIFQTLQRELPYFEVWMHEKYINQKKKQLWNRLARSFQMSAESE